MAYRQYDNPFKRGFERLNPDTMGQTTYVAIAHTFTIEPITGQDTFHYWAMGKKIIKDAQMMCIFPDETNVFYFYLDVDGDLNYIRNEDLTEKIFKENAICGMCYHNAATSKIIIQAVDEQHGVIMDASTHFRQHLRDGMVHLQGGDLTGMADASDVYSGISSTVIADEDITMVIPSASTHTFIYKSGTDGAWVETTTPDNQVGYNGGSGDIYWNEWDGTTWVLTKAASATDYVIYSFLFTNDSINPIKKVIGTSAYATRAVARTAMKNQLYTLTSDGLPGTETFFGYSYIVKKNGDIEDDGSGNPYVDLRNTKGYKID